MTITIKNQTFTLHSTGAIFWLEKATLIISDVHLGKVSHFRKYGAAVPQKVIQKNFELLEEVLHFFKPKSILFLGDLFHSSINNEWNLFEKWITTIKKINIILVAGNHDIISPLKYEELKIKILPELIIENFLFTHHPEIRIDFYNFSGHIHPAIKLKGLGKQSLQLPCFFKKEFQMILPAFGEFTGIYTLVPKINDEIYAISKKDIFKINVEHFHLKRT
tara:strand:+ start:2772 stop:3431 length:660 start_codon:yes stop_codon:yes gene_type:complete